MSDHKAITEAVTAAATALTERNRKLLDEYFENGTPKTVMIRFPGSAEPTPVPLLTLAPLGLLQVKKLTITKGDERVEISFGPALI